MARLRYVENERRGFRRVRAGRGFRFVDGRGGQVRDPRVLDRIRRLAIPPAWRDVWICASETGHIQATGRDARGRKQYRYHARWRQVRDEAKYGRMIEFAQRLPALRSVTTRDLRRSGLPRDKVMAAIVRLLEATLIRVGNEEYARQNRSFGLTTLRDRHVAVRGSRIEFRFRGKSGKDHCVRIFDRRLGRIVQRCQDLPGRSLFQYLDESGRRRSVDSADVNQYLREATAADFSAKDFRTWTATVLAASALRAVPAPRSKAEGNRAVVRAVAGVAARLGNTPAICRRSYVHPEVVAAYLDGSLQALPAQGPGTRRRGLSADEARALTLLASRAGLPPRRPSQRARHRPPAVQLLPTAPSLSRNGIEVAIPTVEPPLAPAAAVPEARVIPTPAVASGDPAHAQVAQPLLSRTA